MRADEFVIRFVLSKWDDEPPPVDAFSLDEQGDLRTCLALCVDWDPDAVEDDDVGAVRVLRVTVLHDGMSRVAWSSAALLFDPSHGLQGTMAPILRFKLDRAVSAAAFLRCVAGTSLRVRPASMEQPAFLEDPNGFAEVLEGTALRQLTHALADVSAATFDFPDGMPPHGHALEATAFAKAPALVEVADPHVPAREGDWRSPSLGTMRWIPPGTFRLGESGDGLEVTLPRGYWMMAHPVTRAQWNRVMDDDPSTGSGPNQPVDGVSFTRALAFARAVSDRDGVAYRLPTEVEWEYAARAGAHTIFAGSDDPDEVAWHCGNARWRTQPVCTKRANGFGLFDMSGNVAEWVQDVYAGYGDDPTVGGTDRILRGGDVGSAPENVAVDVRWSADMNAECEDFMVDEMFVGLRLLREE